MSPTDLPQVRLAFDPFASDWIEDPYPFYKRLRDEAPAFWSEEHQLHAITRFEDVQAAARNWETYTSTVVLDLDGSSIEGFKQSDFIGFDPPRHSRHRNLVKAPFAPKAVSAMAPVIRQRVQELLDRIPSGTPVDFAEQFAFPLPLNIIAREVLGLPHADLEYLGSRLITFLDRSTNGGKIDQHSIRAADELRVYLTAVAADRRATGTGDVLATIASAEPDGRPLTDDEIGAFCLFLFNAGVDTTGTLITNTMYWLQQFPDQRKLVTDDPSLIPATIEESLRYDAPIQTLLRVTTKDVKLHGHHLAPGTRVSLVYGSANRDERRFENPDVFDILRPKQRHVAFGEGIHHCLGAELARVEARIALEAIFEQMPNWEIVGPVERIPKENQRGFRVLTLVR
jgi:cytochrome P450